MNSPQGKYDVSTASRPVLATTQALVQWLSGYFTESKAAGELNLFSHLCIVLNLKNPKEHYLHYSKIILDRLHNSVQASPFNCDEN
jgi:hypothetical protein